mmetsp:Transcript_2282/g.7307  ORF Transcript_2282/g.7307 Transcript_2282/m.7307 type:complete len:99 (+) Transcript_2282:1957-2253(+)
MPIRRIRPAETPVFRSTALLMDTLITDAFLPLHRPSDLPSTHQRLNNRSEENEVKGCLLREKSCTKTAHHEERMSVGRSCVLLFALVGSAFHPKYEHV